MKAIVVREFGPPGVMKLEEVPDPSPGPGQLLIRVRAAGVNPVDVYIRSGNYARKPNLPYTPGADLGGIVEAVGAGVSRVKTGDRVYAHSVAGAYAQLALGEDWQVYPLPDRITFQQGAALGVPYGTAWRALFIRARARAGETLLVHGASGGVGTGAVQIARAHGLRVIGTAGTAEGVTLVRDHGAHDVLNHHDAGYLQQVMPLTAGKGVDVVLEMLANVNLDHDLDVLALHGRVVVIGNRGRVEIDPRKAMGRDAAILGMTLFNATREELHEIHSGIVAGLENGTLNPVIGKELPLADAPKAHEAVMESGALGKIVLIP
ncbi:MAG TPA: NADPH:quinone reductase [Vicinamibacterales bacterium]|nr:NADPH:quinone reductase [Vicinamibacterales bacterium]